MTPNTESVYLETIRELGEEVKHLQRSNDSLQRKMIQADAWRRTAAKAAVDAVEGYIPALKLAPIPAAKQDPRTSGEEIAIAVLSDWQLGKVTESYDSEMCEVRVNRYVEKMLKITNLQRADHPVRRAAVFLVGDMIEGEDIFPGQRNEIDSSLFRQVTVDGPRILGNAVRKIASGFEKVDVYAVIGNHGAIGGRARRDYNVETNTDRMLYQITKMLTEGEERIDWHVPEADWKLVADLGPKCKFLLMHGHQVRGGFAGIPWYGWMKRTLGLTALSARGLMDEFDAIVAGHFHTPTTMYWNDVRVWINASTESHNVYALEQLSAMGRPAQWLLFSKPGFGVTAEYLVSLE